MISFLNGFILPALAAAAIPILLHFLSRKKAKKIPFSTIKFLKAIENQRIRRVKLYQILLILVRTLFIIFLVLAFTRPTISHYGSSASNANTTAFIVLDDSYSMQAYAHSKTYYEIAREKLSVILEIFSKNDAVFVYSQNETEPVRVNFENTEPRLNLFQVSNSVLNVTKALDHAIFYFNQNPNLNCELYFLSDFRIKLPTDIQQKFEPFPDFKAYKIPLAENTTFKNISIDTVIVEQQLVEINKPVLISVFLYNHSASTVETNINLYAGEERVGMEFVSLNGNQVKQLEMNFTPKSNGIHNLKIQLDEDDLSFDNNWFFSLNMPQNVNVLMVTNTSTTELAAAFKILSDNTIFNFKYASYQEWPGLNLNEFNLILFNDLRLMDNNSYTRLKNFTLSGKSIIVIPGDETTLNVYNTFTSQVTGKTLFSVLNTTRDNNYFSMENNKSGNSFFNALFREKNSSFSAPKVYKYFRQSTADQRIVDLTNKDPFISKTGPLITFSSSLNNNWNSLAINGLFIPLIHRLLYYATQQENPVSPNITIDEDISLTTQSGSLSEAYYISEPTGNSYKVIPVFKENRLEFIGSKARQPGIYTLYNDKKALRCVSVNQSSKELIAPLDDNFFTELHSVDYTDQIINARSGMELWIYLLSLAFFMILVEIVLIKVIEGTPILKKA
jgi:hypothetical protein